MKEMNWLETQLNSWEPRRPSARIKRRLFPTPSTRPQMAMAFNWLAPATVCMLLALVVFKQETNISAASPRHDPMVAMMLSNQSSVAYLTGGLSQIRHNILPATFESTNRSGSTSTIRFTPFTKPND
jgi:bacteriorhodopsin